MPETLTIGTPNLAKDLRLSPQARKILAHLETGDTITNNESMLVYHVYRLSDVIMKIRRAGYHISTTMKVDGIGGQYASYKLTK
ncbi:MAG: helix-turn-helix domain-containing protein [Hyphomicrobiales bacterium]